MDNMEILKEAESRALRLTGVQDELDKAAKAKEEADKKAEAKKKADEAKRLASLNVKSATGTSPKATSKDMYAEMEEVYDRLRATG